MSLIEEVRHYLRGSCFTKTLAMILGITETQVLSEVKGIDECWFRAYYRKELVDQVLDRLGISHKIVVPESFGLWGVYLEEALEHGNKVMVLYNAKKGEILTKERPTMKSGHYLEVTSMSGCLFSGRQSSVDGELRKAVVNKDLRDLYDSSCLMKELKVDYGKLLKCRIEIPKHEVETRCRCGKDTCKIYGGTSCRFMCELGGALIILRV